MDNSYFSSIPPERQSLLREMQRLNFGKITNLRISNRQPELAATSPRIVREHRFASDNGPRPELCSDDFLLKQQVVELFNFFDELQNGLIDVLEIKHGLPFRMIVTEVPA